MSLEVDEKEPAAAEIDACRYALPVKVSSDLQATRNVSLPRNGFRGPNLKTATRRKRNGG